MAHLEFHFVDYYKIELFEELSVVPDIAQRKWKKKLKNNQLPQTIPE